jgi:hypothetical protein
MKRVGAGLCFATAVALTMSVAAQQTQPPSTTPSTQKPSTPPSTASPTTQTPSAQSPAAAREMTLTGCVTKGADGMFTLTNVQADSSASTPSATGTAGAAGAAPSSAAGASATWNLRGSDLATHVGHRVQVTGKPAAAASSSGATSGAAGATSGAAGATTATNPDAASRPAAGAAGASASSARTLEVSAVKMIAATCP